jgi:hypothetical protein
MLRFVGPAHSGSGRFTRRSFLQAGTLALGGLSLADILRAEARADQSRPSPQKSVIYIVLAGGPSHLDTYDPKPAAPSEYRGPIPTISTSVPGVHFSELLPFQARDLHNLALLRGIQSVENDHYLSEVYSGLPRSAGQRPAFGSIISKLAPGQTVLPPYIALNERAVDPFEFEKPHYIGAAHAPFRPFGESLEDMQPVASSERLGDRRQLLRMFDGLRKTLDQPDIADGLDQFQVKALDIISSPGVRDAFDLSKESPETIARYGQGKFTHQTVKNLLYDFDVKPFIRARRLVEAGARVVTLQVNSWDHHGGPETDIFYSLRLMVPTLDRCVHALLTDLRERGLANDVLVVMLGEFGRTPKITPQGPGREHWADAGCAIFAGGGLRMGQVIGETDQRAERAVSGQTTFENIIATIYHVLGVDMDVKLPDFRGRPQHLLNDRTPIRQLLG